MKNDQLDETNPNTPFVFMCDHPKCFNMELLASLDKMNSAFTRGNNSDYFPGASNQL